MSADKKPEKQDEEGDTTTSPYYYRYLGYARAAFRNIRPLGELATKSTQKMFISPRAFGGRIGRFIFSKVLPKEGKFLTRLTARYSPKFLSKLAGKVSNRFFVKTLLSARLAPKLAHYFPELYKSVAHVAIDVRGSYLMTELYILADTAYAVWSAHKDNKKNVQKNERNEETERRQEKVGKAEEAGKGEQMATTKEHDEHQQQHSLLKVTAEKLVFHTAATVVLPVVVLDGVSHYSAHYFFPRFWKPSASFRNANINKYGPSMLSVAMIPTLPFLIDEPVEYVVKKLFNSSSFFSGRKLSS